MDEEELGEGIGSQTLFNETHVENLDERATDGRGRSEDDIRILVASDIHVGYGENKPVIAMDSVNTFEEVLQIATREKVDMVLLGGDLFHENVPSRAMMCKVVQLLRKYCLNDNDVLIEFVSDPSVNFRHSHFDRVNYEDMNLNVGLPVFTIHGNHDDMAAKGLTALDELHESGLINLFGKFEDGEGFEVSPLLLKKGETRLALYGIGSQRDDRLNRAFESAAIKFFRPRAEAEGWFNMLTLHQNRPPRSATRSTASYLPVKYIPSFFDVVVWGHEHECRIQPEYVEVSAEMEGDGFFIIQPGSTVATSLTTDEAVQKCVTILTIRGRKFKTTPIPLETTRQIVVDKLILDRLPPDIILPPNGSRPGPLYDDRLIKEKLREMIRGAEATRGPRQPALPLIRLNVVYSGPWAHMSPPNNRQFALTFAVECANPSTMLMTKRQKEKKEKGTKETHSHFSALDPSNVSVEDMVSAYFRAAPTDEQLTVYLDNTLKSAMATYVASEGTATVMNKKLDETFESAATAVIEKLKKIQMKRVDEGGDLDADFEENVENDLKSLRKLMFQLPHSTTS